MNQDQQPPVGMTETKQDQLEQAQSRELILWIGEANGVTATATTSPGVTLFVKPILAENYQGVALVDETGKVFADQVVSR